MGKELLLTFPETRYTHTHMKNFALPGNPNDTLSRKAALDYLVDCCLNVEETEWAACSVRVKPMDEAINDIAKVARLSFVDYDDMMLVAAYDIIQENIL